MSQDPRISPVWFDTEQGTLIVATTHELRPIKPTIHRLGELLCAENFPYKTGDFEQIIPTNDWGEEECKVFGQWILRVLHPYTSELSPDHRFTREHIRRARVLGVGPTDKRIRKHFDTLDNYREALGVHGGKTLGKYNEWSRQDFATYAADVVKRLKLSRRPTEKDYYEAHKKWGGPTEKIIRRRIGGFPRLNEMIGYPNFSDWDEDDFIQWGTDVMQANGEAYPSDPLIDAISKRQAGPARTAIRGRFDTLLNFQHLVMQKRQEQLEEYAEHRDAQLRWAKESLDKESLAIVEDLPEAEQLAFIGRYRTAQKCLRDFQDVMYRRLAQSTSDAFMQQVLKLNAQSGFTAGNVEETAEMLGVFNDIWPPVEYLKRLRVDVSNMYQKPRLYKGEGQEELAQKAA